MPTKTLRGSMTVRQDRAFTFLPHAPSPLSPYGIRPLLFPRLRASVGLLPGHPAESGEVRCVGGLDLSKSTAAIMASILINMRSAWLCSRKDMLANVGILRMLTLARGVCALPDLLLGTLAWGTTDRRSRRRSKSACEDHRIGIPSVWAVISGSSVESAARSTLLRNSSRFPGHW